MVPPGCPQDPPRVPRVCSVDLVLVPRPAVGEDGDVTIADRVWALSRDGVLFRAYCVSIVRHQLPPSAHVCATISVLEAEVVWASVAIIIEPVLNRRVTELDGFDRSNIPRRFGVRIHIEVVGRPCGSGVIDTLGGVRLARQAVCRRAGPWVADGGEDASHTGIGAARPGRGNATIQSWRLFDKDKIKADGGGRKGGGLTVAWQCRA